MRHLPFLLVLLTLAACFRKEHAPAAAAAGASEARLRAHLTFLTTTPQPRNYQHVAVLDTVAAYLGRHLKAAGARVEDQPYVADGSTYRNVIGSFGPTAGPRIIIGAHYDVCGNQPGADDNGSGVAALLELARLLGQESKLPGRIDLVAYSTEEPPYFRTPQMGSYVHAKSLHDAGVAVRGMVSLEMLGYYDDRKNAQKYPVSILKLVYGSRGNYITAVRKFGDWSFANQFSRRFEDAARLPVKHFKGPASLPGVDFSDHASYWAFGFPALMITDTSFYRNPHYHEPTDTMATLNFERIALVVDGVLGALLAL